MTSPQAAISKGQKSRSKKEEILAKAIEIFEQEGYDRPTMDSIAQRACVSKRTLYKHFPSKKLILEEILVFLLERNHNSMSFKFDEQAPILEQLENILRQKSAFMLCSNNMQLTRILISEFLTGHVGVQTHMNEVLKGERVTLKWLKAAQAHGRLSKDKSAYELLRILNELVNGIIFFPFLFGKKKEVSAEDLAMIAKMFFAVAA